MSRIRLVLSGCVLVFALVFLFVLWSVNSTNKDGLVLVPGNLLRMLPRPSTQLAFTAPDQDGMLDIFVAHIDGGHVRHTNLTRSPYNDTSPTWSPDGGQIAFASERDGTPAIYRMDVERAAETYLVDGTSPAWSPDGQRIAFVARSGGHETLFTIEPDGSNQVAVTDNGGQGIAHPQWSPDGHSLLFTTDDTGVSDIFVIRSDGTNLRRVGHGMVPTWAPDSRQIAFAAPPSTRSTMNPTIHIVNIGGMTQFILPVDDGSISNFPTWSPNGGQIAFTLGQRDSGVQNTLYLMNRDGSEVRLFTERRGIYNSLTWSPDGQYIAVEYSPSVLDGLELWLIAIDGSERIRVYDGIGRNPVWRP